VKTTLVCSDVRPEVKLSGVARQGGRRPRTVTFRATSRSPTLPRKLSHRWDEQERMLGVAWLCWSASPSDQYVDPRSVILAAEAGINCGLRPLQSIRLAPGPIAV
jgi:hypothetical protein